MVCASILFFIIISKNLKTDSRLSAEPARIELGRKKEQMAIAVGFWEQRVESYKKLLGSCEAQLSSSRAELRATEKKLARLGEEFSAYGPQATHVISAPNWAAEVVMDGESRLAHLAAIDTPVRVSLFGSIESEKQNLAKLLGQENPTLD